MSSTYDPADFPAFAVTVDLVVLTVRPPNLEVLLVRRAEAPQKGRWALPGGFVGPSQDLADAAESKLVDKTGIRVKQAHLEQLQTFGQPKRDPRMRVVSVAHLAMVAVPSEPELEGAAWHTVGSLDAAALAFDHAEILQAGVERARSKLEYTTLATSFCRSEFTLAELRSVYEAAWGERLDAANFQRKVLATEGFVESTGRTESAGPGRPARTFVAGRAELLHPPLMPPGAL